MAKISRGAFPEGLNTKWGRQKIEIGRYQGDHGPLAGHVLKRLFWPETLTPLPTRVKLFDCLQKGPYFKDLVLNKDLFGILGPYWVLIYISGSLFSLFWFHSRKECQLCTKSWINHMRHITCSLKPSFAHENCLIFAGIGSGLHCYQFFIFTYAYALIFIHRCFGSLFWLLGVLIRSLFHKKWSLLGPYLKAWGSLLDLEAVQ